MSSATLWAPLKNLLGYLQKVWGLETLPRWDYLQVEVSTRCNLRGCLMCPRTAWPDRWQSQDLAWETFEALLPSVKFFSQVHLCGWGEPLLHPRLWDMARLLRDQGVEVSLTTNGLDLNEAAQIQALDYLEMVAISVDGARAETYEKLRPGADFQRVTGQIAALCERKRSLGLKKPEVVVTFLKMRPNLAELPEMIKLAASLGVDRVNAPNLDFIPVPEIESLSLLAPGPPDPGLEAVQQAAAAEAAALKMPFRDFSPSPKYDLRVCAANPLRNVFLTVAGEAAPCAYLGLPLAGTFQRCYLGQSYPAGNYSYGNVREHNLLQLSQRPDYLNFIDYFKGPSTIFSLLHPVGDAVPTPTAGADSQRAPVISHCWPPACAGCLKNLGL